MRRQSHHRSPGHHHRSSRNAPPSRRRSGLQRLRTGSVDRHFTAGLSGGSTPPADPGLLKTNNVLLVVWNPKSLDGTEHAVKRQTRPIHLRHAPLKPGVERIRSPGDGGPKNVPPDSTKGSLGENSSTCRSRPTLQGHSPVGSGIPLIAFEPASRFSCLDQNGIRSGDDIGSLLIIRFPVFSSNHRPY